MYRSSQSDVAFLYTTMLSPRADATRNANRLPAGTIIWVTVTSFLFLALIVLVCCIALSSRRGRRLRADLLREWIVFKFWMNARYTEYKEGYRTKQNERRAKRQRKEERRANLRAVSAQGSHGIGLHDIQAPAAAHLV